MAESSPSFPVIREAVASFPDRAHFHRAVSNLLAVGFDTTDLSVLASHDSLAAAGEPPGRQPKLLPAGLADEIKYIAPLTVAAMKESFNDSAGEPSFSAYLDREADRFTRVLGTQDATEAARAFLEKRSPRFEGR